MTGYTVDPLSACCGDPGDCNQAHLYCFNRTPKEGNVDAMRTFEAAFGAAMAAVDPANPTDPRSIISAERAATQAAINGASHGTVEQEMAEIKRPDHYARFAIEPCTFIMFNELPYWAGNVVKYVTRAPHKHSDERIDIRKAIRYCEMRIEELDRVAAGTDGNVVGNPL